MAIEVRPLNVLCNIQCQYCYQNPQRDSGSTSNTYDMKKIKDAIIAEGGRFSLFGGEALLVPVEDLEELWSFGYARYGANGVQTNGTLISNRHIELFRKYRVHVGISVDGPGELNDVRWHGNLERTRESTAKTQAAIETLCREGMHPSLIITLHRGNAAVDKLPTLIAWVRHLAELGVTNFRLHLLESESPEIRERYSLTVNENGEALMAFRNFNKEVPELNFHLFHEMRDLLLGEDQNVTCIWKACDSYTTSAVRGIEGQGQRSNCGRTNKFGVDFVKSAEAGFERYVALHNTPQSDGGCKSCRFFLMCKGQCPGTSIDGDWRNRTEHCEVWKALFETLEKELLDEGARPLSLSPDRARVEAEAVARWSGGLTVSLTSLTKSTEWATRPVTPVLSDALQVAEL